MNNYNIYCLQPVAAATGGGSALNDLVDLNFGGGAPAQVKTQLHKHDTEGASSGPKSTPANSSKP